MCTPSYVKYTHIVDNIIFWTMKYQHLSKI